MIFPVVLITPVTVHPRFYAITVPDPVSHYEPLEQRLLKYVYDPPLSARL